MIGLPTPNNKMQTQVKKFMAASNQTIGTTPAIRDKTLRSRLIREEAAETLAAIEQDNLVEAVDGLCDLLYVVFGTFVSFGINAQTVFDEVHSNNMEKTRRKITRDEHGKILKDPNWQPPNIEGLLIAMGWNAEEEGKNIVVTQE